MSDAANTVYVDVHGLTMHRHDQYYALLAEQLPPHTPVPEHERLALLGRLRQGAGVTVLTGPEGAAFWLLVSIEVNVRIVPDDIDFVERTKDEMEWALRVQRVTRTRALNMSARYTREKPPTQNHGNHAEWLDAIKLVDALPRRSTPIIRSPASYTIIRDEAEQLRFLDALDERVSMDWEWQKPDEATEDRPAYFPHSLEIGNAEHTWHLPVVALDYQSREGHHQDLREAAARMMRRNRTIWQNAKADLNTQWPGDPLDAFGLDLDDTIVMGYLAGENVLGLKPMTRAFLGRDPMDYPDGHKGGLGTLPLEVGARYGAAGDARNTWDLEAVLRARLRGMGRVMEVYENIERPIVPMVASMERYGMPADVAHMQHLEDEFQFTEDAMRGLWQGLEGLDIATDANIRAIVKRRTGYDPGSVKADVLAKVEEDWMDSIMGFRQVRHRRRGFLSAHVRRWLAEGQPDPYILYSSFNQAGGQDRNDPRSFLRAPRSGRFSSSGDAGNLQNQPGDIRDIFTAPPGCLFWSLDYSNLEMRIAAGLSTDRAMLGVLTTVCPTPDEDGECPHSPGCGDMHDDFQVRIRQRTGVDVGRRAAKAGNFLSQYGGYADQLIIALAKQRAFLDYETAKLIVETHRDAYPSYYALNKTVIDTAKRNGGHAETHFGRWRTDEDLFSYDATMRGHAERALGNHLIQGTAADILKMAMGRAVPILRHYGAHLSAQVHDELCGWVPEEKAEDFIIAMTAVMESIRIPNIHLNVSGGAGRTWADVH
jgi:DNA polymerase I-like protein with 3'-5' exonuclease and polymerase domains